MKNIILWGANGRMGKAIVLSAEKMEINIVAGIDLASDKKNAFPVFQNYNEITVTSDGVIDFSRPSSLNDILDFCLNKKLPLVIGCTGHSDEQLLQIKSASQIIPIFMSSNMSIGVSVLKMLCKKTAEIMGDFDIEIIEKHHNHKADAPSGTALSLAKAINDTLNSKLDFMFGRSPDSGKRNKTELGIHSVRGGTIVGSHDVMFIGNGESLTLSHNAESTEIFSNGALTALKFLQNKPPKLYDMDDLVN